MSTLVTLAHGSRHPGADVETLSARAGAAAVAYLDFSPRTLEVVAEELATPLVVVPLLFTRAYHARFDAPEAAKQASAHAPVTLAEPIGAGDDVAQLFGEPQGEPVLFHVGSRHSTEAEQMAARLGWHEAAATKNGVAKLQDLAQRHGRLHVFPLFVTEGLLLDQARTSHYPGEVHFDAPLGTKLAPIVRTRFEEAA